MESAQLILLVISAICILAILLLFVVSRDGRRTLHKLFFLAKTLLCVDVGPRGLVLLFLYAALPAAGVAFAKGIGNGAAKPFDWATFGIVFFTITLIGAVSNLIAGNSVLKRILGPQAGRVWRDKRKTATAGILKRIAVNLGKSNVSRKEVRQLLRDILDVVVLHIRDHRGSFGADHHDVFANLLLDSGQELIVVARDNMAHSSKYERQCPKAYSKSGLLGGRALEARKPLSVGMLEYEYPEGPQNKPYKSILSIPLFPSLGDCPYGVLSVDSTRPYFFQSFSPGDAENDLENSLQPYLAVVTIVLESFISRDFSEVVKTLSRAENTR